MNVGENKSYQFVENMPSAMVMFGRATCAFVIGALVLGLSGCSGLFPSRPLSDNIFVRSGAEAIELVICSSGEIEPLVVGRGVQRANSELFPLIVNAVTVANGVPLNLGELTALPSDSSLLAPLKVGERLGLTLQMYDGEQRFRIEADFSITEEAFEGFARGDWLSPSSELTSEPCAD